jgi:DNA-binding response OmpR family regulator
MSQKHNNILIVDDEPDIREVMGMMLAENGYRIRTAEDGIQALEMIKEEAPDLILLDMNMPRMSGVVFYQNIANTHGGGSKYPVLIITGRTALEQVFKDFEVDGFISKPFNFDDLNAQVAKTLAKHYGI